MRPADLLHACRVPASVEPRRVGPWEIRRIDVASLDNEFTRAFVRMTLAGYDSYTLLFRDTLATLHEERGECVMEDSLVELRRHLPILLSARGRVLVSGLGLGCVVRGLLAKPEVEHVDVVEIDRHILALVGREFSTNPRVSLYHDDAERITWPAGTRWDFAWHDVWSETESLDVVHARLIARYHGMAARQGAWQLARVAKRRWPFPLVGGPRRRAA